jgi:hypothetical protein
VAILRKLTPTEMQLKWHFKQRKINKKNHYAKKNLGWNGCNNSYTDKKPNKCNDNYCLLFIIVEHI